MAKQKSIAQNTIMLYIRTFIVMIVGLYTSRVILKALGETDYGVYNVVGGIVGMLGFLNASLSGATSRFLTNAIGQGNQEYTNQVFSASLNLHILLSIFIVIIGETAGVWLLYNKLVIPPNQMSTAFWLLQFSIITSIFVITAIPYNASLISHENMSVYAYMGLYDAFAKLAIALIIDYIDSERLIFYGFLLMINSIISIIIYRIYAIRHYPECRLRLIRNKTLYKKLSSYSIWDMTGNIAAICQGQGINILLNMFFGPIANTARAISFQVLSGVTSFLGGFTTASRPRIIKYYAQGNYDEMYRLTFITAKISFLLIFILALPILFEIRYILHLWLGNDVPTLTYSFTTIIIITALFDSFNTAYLMAFHAIGRIKTGNQICGTFKIMALPISYLALKLGAHAISVFVIILIINVICHCISWKIVYGYHKFSVKELLSTVYIPCLLVAITSIILPGILSSIMPDNTRRFVVILLVSWSTVALLAYFIGFTKRERSQVINPMLTNILEKLHIYKFSNT